VRQHGNFSFTRVYESGHEVPAYQPETAYAIFQRAMFNKDIPTGKFDTSAANSTTFTTTGPSDTWAIKNDVPESPEPTCYILSPSSCTDDVLEAVIDGTAIIQDYIVIGFENGTSTNVTIPSAFPTGSTVASSSSAPSGTESGNSKTTLSATASAGAKSGATETRTSVGAQILVVGVAVFMGMMLL
jgi:Serine carboxypeptidase